MVAWAAPQPRLVVLPFSVYSQEDLSYLKKSIPRLLEERLEAERIKIVHPVIEDRPGAVSVEWARDMVYQTAVDYSVFGSVSKIGNNVSVDAVLVSAEEGRKPVSVYEVGMGLENLTKILDEVAMKLVSIIYQKELVASVTVSGNRRIEADAILKEITTKSGEVFSLKKLDSDLKAIYKLGFFEEVAIGVEDSEAGKRVEFKVLEKPSISSITISGNEHVKDDEALEAINIKPYSILDLGKITDGIEAVKELYRQKGYLNINISYTIEEDKERTVVVLLDVDEGEKAYIREIRFTGNESFSDKKLRGEMQTSTKGLLSWIFHSGKLEWETLNQDVDRISSFYYNNGYIRAKVGEPQVEVEEDSIFITIPINEGPQYKIASVGLEGDFVKPVQELTQSLETKSDIIYNRELIQKDILSLRDIYADFGYAFAEIDPSIEINDEEKVVHITYQITRGKKIFFERITVVGNTKTRDKVIRRELQVTEGSQFSSRKLRKSSEKLNRLDFFETVDLATSEGSDDSKLNLRIEVTEKKTGTFSIGAGFSSADGLIGLFDVSQRNFLGRGQELTLAGQVGGKNQRFSLNFTEPWTFDTRLTTSAEAYNWVRSFIDYDKDAFGGSIQGSYPIWRDLRASLKYRYESAKVTDVADDAAQIIKDQEGRTTTSSVTFGVRWDSRDKVFLPTRGQVHTASIEKAGSILGGSSEFTQYNASTAWYFPLIWGTVGHLSSRIGYITEDKEGGLPIYEKFYLGGIDSIRGFERYSISPRDAATGDRIGGRKMWMATAELRFPLVPKAGLFGAAFFDVGNVFAEEDSFDFANLRQSVGVGIRWFSPMGPLRVEWGLNLDPEPDEDSSVFDFAIGGRFH